MKSCKLAFFFFNSKTVSFQLVEDRTGYANPDFCRISKYDGINDSFFVAPIAVRKIIDDMVSACEKEKNERIREIYLILPQKFFYYNPVIKSCTVKNGIVSEEAVARLKEQSIVCPPGFIKISEICGGYRCDKEGNFLSDVVGKKAGILETIISPVGLSQNVVEFFDSITKKNGIKFYFVPQTMPIISKINREYSNKGILVCINEKNTDFVFFENEFPLRKDLISRGSLYITDMLAESFSVSHEVAESLKKEINLGLPFTEPPYKVFSDGKIYSFNVKDVNVKLFQFLEVLSGCLSDFIRMLPVSLDFFPIYIVGSDDILTHGFCEFIQNRIEKSLVTTVLPDYSVWNKPKDITTEAFVLQMLHLNF